VVLTPAEKQRRYREKQKQQGSIASRSSEVYKAPFFEEFKYSQRDLDVILALAGIEAPQIEDDTGPRENVFDGAIDGLPDPFSGAKRSLGRAEVLVGQLLEAARVVAFSINEFKIAEIEKRLTEIESADLKDPEKKQAAFADAAKLMKMRHDLERQVRFTLPAWEASA
jgi:hypothetical protein